MQQDTKRYLSYICPRCRQSVIVERDLFSLAASTAHIKCPCGKSELTVDFQPSRVRLTVPCLFCGREHEVSCPTLSGSGPWPFPAPPPVWTAAMWGRRGRCTPPPPG